MVVVITFCPRCEWWTVGPFAAVVSQCENCKAVGHKSMMEELELLSLEALWQWRMRHPNESKRRP